MTPSLQSLLPTIHTPLSSITTSTLILSYSLWVFCVYFVSSSCTTSPREYCRWYEATHPWVTPDTPRVGILLYRKHVITEQGKPSLH